MAQSVIKQIGVGGVVGVVVGTLGGLIGIIAGFAASPILGVIYTVVFVGVGCLLWFTMFKPMVESNRLLETGEPAEATILVVKENGSSLKMGGAIAKAGVDILLDVRPKDMASYHATVHTYVSMFEMEKYQVGSIVQVKFDPKNPQLVVIAEMTQPLQNFSSTQKK